MLQAPAWVAALLLRGMALAPGALAAAAARTPLRSVRAVRARIWSPHAATTVIGITFVLMLLLAGAWAYTDVLAELARGMAAQPARRAACCSLALLLGAVWGGWTAGRWRSDAHRRRRSCCAAWPAAC